LKSLFISRDFIHNCLNGVIVVSLLFEKFGKYLENISFGMFMKSISEQILLLGLIKNYCIKIKSFYLCIMSTKSIHLTLDIIKINKQNLNYLSIDKKYYHIDYDYSKIILLNLGQILPYKLEHLFLQLNNIESIHGNLEAFLKNSKNTFMKELIISIDAHVMNILPCIKKYIMKEKRARYLAIKGIENQELFSIVERSEFKSYNIKVIPSKYLDIYDDNRMFEL
jgi:hypothetical protein